MTKKQTEWDFENIRQKATELLKRYTKHQDVRLVNRGNAAIFAALYIAKKVNPKPFVLIPDQGGWISYKTYPKMLGFDIRTIHTNRGIIDLMDLERKAESGAALICPSFAGYFAEQSMQYIHNICKEKGCLLIEDASGSLGDRDLCDGEHADMIVGSFGKWKIADAGYGGFVSGKTKLLQEGKEAFSLTTFHPRDDTIVKKLEQAPERLARLLELQAKVKQELKGMAIVHPDLRGLNVVVRYTEQAEKEKIIEYCGKKGYDYVECPKYIRLEEEAISIELKRLDTKKTR